MNLVTRLCTCMYNLRLIGCAIKQKVDISSVHLCRYTCGVHWSINVPDDCSPCDGQLISWYDAIMSSDDKIKVAQFSSKQDDVLQYFMDMLK